MPIDSILLVEEDGEGWGVMGNLAMALGGKLDGLSLLWSFVNSTHIPECAMRSFVVCGFIPASVGSH